MQAVGLTVEKKIRDLPDHHPSERTASLSPNGSLACLLPVRCPRRRVLELIWRLLIAAAAVWAQQCARG